LVNKSRVRLSSACHRGDTDDEDETKSEGLSCLTATAERTAASKANVRRKETRRSKRLRRWRRVRRRGNSVRIIPDSGWVKNNSYFPRAGDAWALDWHFAALIGAGW